MRTLPSSRRPPISSWRRCRPWPMGLLLLPLALDQSRFIHSFIIRPLCTTSSHQISSNCRGGALGRTTGEPENDNATPCNGDNKRPFYPNHENNNQKKKEDDVKATSRPAPKSRRRRRSVDFPFFAYQDEDLLPFSSSWPTNPRRTSSPQPWIIPPPLVANRRMNKEVSPTNSTTTDVIPLVIRIQPRPGHCSHENGTQADLTSATTPNIAAATPSSPAAVPTATSRTVVQVPRPRRYKPTVNWWTRLFYKFMGTASEPSWWMMDSLQTKRQSRLLKGRAYAKQEPFSLDNLHVPPSLADLASPPLQWTDALWISSPFRILTFAVSFALFPQITHVIDDLVTMPMSQLSDIISQFGSGISILYATFISLTLSILYTRQRNIQGHVARECALLVMAIRQLLTLLERAPPEAAVEAGQCAADQIRTLVRSSRGQELMLVMYSDPYSRMLELVDEFELETLYGSGAGSNGPGGTQPYDGRYNSLLASCRETLKELATTRSQRLSDEALALPSTHFLILNVLTFLILSGYVISCIPATDQATGDLPMESSLLFGVFTTVYVLFYNFAADLNNPFQGVYQVRRSCAASHLLQAKWLIVNHPLLRGQVDFEEDIDEQDEESGNVLIRSPGLGDLWFELDDIYVDKAVARENPFAEEEDLVDDDDEYEGNDGGEKVDEMETIVTSG